MTAPRLLLISLPGADWAFAQPLLDRQHLPQLNRLVERGVMGQLHSAQRIRPSIAASLATGRRPDGHGILAYNRPDAAGTFGLRPVQSTDLRATPIWDVVAQSGMKSEVVGWPATHPAKVFDSSVVSDVFAYAKGSSFDEWSVDPDAISDSDLVEQLAEFRLHPTEVTPDMVLPFLPAGGQIDQETDERLQKLITTLARASTIHGAATWIAENRDWNLLAVHFDFIERMSSAFLQYAAPRMAHVTEVDHEIYRAAVEGAYHFFDMFLGRYLDLVGDDCYVILASAHGFLTGDARVIPSNSQATRNYRAAGMMVMAGPNVRQDELVFGASVHDITPTALALLGVPLGRELDGQVLQEAFRRPLEFEEIDPVAPPDYAERCGSETDRDRAFFEIVEHARWNYYPEPSSNAEVANEHAELEWQGNLAYAKIVVGDFSAALVCVGRMRELDPDDPRGLTLAAQCYLGLKETEQCREVLDELSELGIESAFVSYLNGRLAIEKGDIESAESHFDEVKNSAISGVARQHLLEDIGAVQIESRQFARAERTYRAALAIDARSRFALNGLGAALLQLGRDLDAAEHFDRSLAVHYRQADVHCDLGQCLFAMGRLEEAAESYRRSLAIQPELKVPKHGLKRTEIAIAARATKKPPESTSSS